MGALPLTLIHFAVGMHSAATIATGKTVGVDIRQLWESACGTRDNYRYQADECFGIDGNPPGSLTANRDLVTCKSCTRTVAFDEDAARRRFAEQERKLEARRRRTAVLAEAKNRALERLARDHADVYRDLYEAELAVLMLDPRRPSVRIVPRPDQL